AASGPGAPRHAPLRAHEPARGHGGPAAPRPRRPPYRAPDARRSPGPRPAGRREPALEARSDGEPFVQVRAPPPGLRADGSTSVQRGLKVGDGDADTRLVNVAAPIPTRLVALLGLVAAAAVAFVLLLVT